MTPVPLRTLDPMTETVRVARRAARVLVLDEAGRVLLLRGYDPAKPADRYWFTVGGGLAEGETAEQAAARELFEETGLRRSPHDFGSPVHADVTSFSFDGVDYRQEQAFFLIRVPEFEVDRSGWDETERRSMDDHRWWSAAELVATTERYYPPGLPDLLREVA